MRYVHTNDDGSIGLWSCVPLRVVRTSDKDVFTVSGVSRNATQTILQGSWGKKPGSAIIVGGGAFDVADLEVNSLPGYTIEFPDFDEDIKAKLHSSQADRIVGHRKGTKAEIPADYSFRAAWKATGTSIAVDMPKAKEVTRERLRKERKPLMEALDIEAMKAVEAKDDAKLSEVAGEKQRLRDITALPEIDAATTPDQLKAIKVE